MLDSPLGSAAEPHCQHPISNIEYCSCFDGFTKTLSSFQLVKNYSTPPYQQIKREGGREREREGESHESFVQNTLRAVRTIENGKQSLALLAIERCEDQASVLISPRRVVHLSLEVHHSRNCEPSTGEGGRVTTSAEDAHHDFAFRALAYEPVSDVYNTTAGVI